MDSAVAGPLSPQMVGSGASLWFLMGTERYQFRLELTNSGSCLLPIVLILLFCMSVIGGEEMSILINDDYLYTLMIRLR